MASQPRVLTIPASRPFLPTLAQAILDGRVLPGWPDPADPLSFASGTILMPNRRTCRELRAVFATLMGAGDAAMLLPRIAPIGDVDEDEWAFADPQPLDVIGLDDLRPAIRPLDRQLTLAGLVRDWAARVDRAVMRLEPGDPLMVSTATADALALAADLMRLMDSAATERVPWSQLDTIVESGLDTFWQMTRTFLAIATDHWPAHLESLGLEEPAVRRDRLIAELAPPPGGRVVVAMSGGVDSSALYPPKRFFGAARNIEEGGSLTIIATAMVETGSTGDTVIFEEFKGTGNAELKLDRGISERRVFPAVDVNPSGTRKDELLLVPEEARIMTKLRRILSALDSHQAIDLLIKQLKKTRSNGEFLMQVASSAPMAADKDEEDYV